MGKRRNEKETSIYVPAEDVVDLCEVRDLARSVCDTSKSPKERKGCKIGVDLFLDATVAHLESLDQAQKKKLPEEEEGE